MASAVFFLCLLLALSANGHSAKLEVTPFPATQGAISNGTATSEHTVPIGTTKVVPSTRQVPTTAEPTENPTGETSNGTVTSSNTTQKAPTTRNSKTTQTPITLAPTTESATHASETTPTVLTTPHSKTTQTPTNRPTENPTTGTSNSSATTQTHSTTQTPTNRPTENPTTGTSNSSATTQTHSTTQTPTNRPTENPTTGTSNSSATTQTHSTTQTPTNRPTEKPTTKPSPTTQQTTETSSATTPTPTTLTTQTTLTVSTTHPTERPTTKGTASTTVFPSVITNAPEVSSTPQSDSTVFPIQTTSPPTTPNPSSTSSKPTTHSPTTTDSTPNNTATSTRRPTTSHPTTVTRSPTTTSIPTPTTPVTPLSPPNPWNVTYGTNGTNCIMLKFAAQVDITYVNIHNKTVTTGFDIPENATVNRDLSMCDPKGATEVLALDFQSHSLAHGYLVAIFKKDAKTNVSSLFEVMITHPITETVFPGISKFYLNKVILLSQANLTMFEADSKHSYSCQSLSSIKLTSIQVKNSQSGQLISESDSVFTKSTLQTRKLQVQAFLPTKKNMIVFMTSTKCNADVPDTLWTVDFIVALAVAVCTVIVLLAYFMVKRFKKNADDETLPILHE